MEHSCCHGETLNQWLLLHSDRRIPPQTSAETPKIAIWSSLPYGISDIARDAISVSHPWIGHRKIQGKSHSIHWVTMFPYSPHENSHEKNGAHPPCSETPPPILRVILSESLVLQTTTFEKKKKNSTLW